MKKLFLTIVAMLSMTVAMAENENANSMNNTEAYNIQINVKKLGQTLHLTSDQMETVAELNKTFSAELLFAGQANEGDRKDLVEKAVKKHIGYMHYILSDSQYHKYLQLLNVTLYNRGLRN